MRESTLLVLVFAAGSALSFLFSGMEAGVFALNRWRIRRQMKAGKRGAKVLHGFMQAPENFFWTILVGNTLANFAVISVGAAVVQHWWTGKVRWLVPLWLAAVFLFYALADLLPKMIFRQFPNRLCMALAVPFRFVHLSLTPLVGLVAWFSNSLLRLTRGQAFRGHVFSSRSELKLAMQESSQNLSWEERAMINRVMELDAVPVRTITIPFSQVQSVSADTPTREAVRIFREQPFSRLPVWKSEGGRRRIVGVAHVDSLLYEDSLVMERPIGEVVPFPLFFLEDLSLDQAMRRMQQKGSRVAVVVARDQREIGIVTLADILRFIFGEINL